MKYLLFYSLSIIGSFAYSQSKNIAKNDIPQNNLIQYINRMIGTAKYGHTFPGATMPFGMVQLSPDTDIEGWDYCSGYHYEDSIIMGFSHTHLSGTGDRDLVDVLLMPSTGKLQLEKGNKFKPDSGFCSRFSHKDEFSEPGYYSVLLKDYDIKAELTASTRAGFHRYTFYKDDTANIILDLTHLIKKKTAKVI